MDAPALLRAAFDAAVAGAAPGPVTARATGELALPVARGIWVIAIGKAAVAMAGGALAALRDAGPAVAGGLVVAPAGEDGAPAPLELVHGDHPIPGAHSLHAAERLGDLTLRVGASEVALVLVSGGTSSLIAAPVAGVPADALPPLAERLLGSGLDIHRMNVVRKRFARWGAGRLALALAPARIHCLALSDVIGDDLASIGSGPCVPDPATAEEVRGILRDAHLLRALPAALVAYLDDVIAERRPETPKPGDPVFAHVDARVIASNRLALDAAAARLRALGVADARVDPRPLSGEARQAGVAIAESLLALPRQGSGTTAVLRGGETTVTLGAMHGRGGRCQELALAAARVLHEAGERGRGITLLAAGTDGRDGPTDAAGAIVDAGTWERIASRGVDPRRALDAHDAWHALDAAGALLRTGLTGTNVMDVVIGLVASPAP